MSIMYLTKCCFCVPLRNGLLLFALLKILAFIGYSSMLWVPSDSSDATDDEKAINLTISVIFSVSMAFEMVFVVLLIGGTYKQNYKLVRISYIYNVLLLGIEILTSVVYIPLNVYGLYVYEKNDVWREIVLLMTSALLIMIFQVYLVILIRSLLCSMREQCVSDPKTSAYCIRKPYVVY